MKIVGRATCVLILSVGLAGLWGCGSQEKPGTALQVEVSFSPEAHSDAITGRVYVVFADSDQREPRFQVSTNGVPFFGADIERLAPGEAAEFKGEEPGYPIEHMADLPAGDYFVQGFVNIYTEFQRSDAHTLWMHKDQWEGQRWNRSPGNLYSDVVAVHIDPREKKTIKLECASVVPPVTIPPDTPRVKRIKFQSAILSEFWGQPMYLGAVVLLPEGYDESPDRSYPVNYIQGHFSLRTPYGFVDPDSGSGSQRSGRGAGFTEYWLSDECPRMLAVTLQHPCPYYDDSYAVNSPNVGPYGDAIMQELIPHIEESFRIIQEPYARVLSGGSTGGWIALALQVFYPEFFGGTFSLCPDPVDFRYFQCIDIYGDNNAYFKDFGWRQVPTASDRDTSGITLLTSKQRNQYELVLGTRGRSGEQVDIFEAAYGPIGEDGYVKPLFDPRTGDIDPEVADYWREHFDLRHILERDWEKIGPLLEGKIHIYTGDMDTYYLNNAVVLLERFLEKTENPYYRGVIEYGDGKPHCWGPYGADLIKLIGKHIEKSRGR
ncbi:MAG: alpha/beta hydrolase-fold protein [Candidatus Aminicenantaceae bacterium]